MLTYNQRWCQRGEGAMACGWEKPCKKVQLLHRLIHRSMKYVMFPSSIWIPTCVSRIQLVGKFLAPPWSYQRWNSFRFKGTVSYIPRDFWKTSWTFSKRDKMALVLKEWEYYLAYFKTSLYNKNSANLHWMFNLNMFINLIWALVSR